MNSQTSSALRHIVEHDDARERRRSPRRRRQQVDTNEDFKIDIKVPATANVIDKIEPSCEIYEGGARGHGPHAGQVIISEAPLAAAIRRWYIPGRPFIVALRGRISENCFIAGGYSTQGAAAFLQPNGEYASLDVRIFGVSDDAELAGGLFLGDGARDFGTVGRFELWNTGVRVGLDGTRCVRNFDVCGPVIFDGCHWLPSYDGKLKSGMELGDPCEFVMIRNHKRVRDEANNRLVRFDEHSLGYLKGQGAVYIINNDCGGGGRTAMQLRPHLFPWQTSAQRGPVLIQGNTAVDPDPDHGDGGHMFTIWNSMNDPVLFKDNDLNCPYGGLSLAWQPAAAGNFTDRDGLAHKLVGFEGNTVVAQTRSAVQINAAREVHFLGGNHLQGMHDHKLLIGSETAVGWGSPANREVWFHDIGEAVAMNPQAWVEALDEYVELGDARLEQMLWKGANGQGR